MNSVSDWFRSGILSDGDAPVYGEATIICITARVGSTALVSALANSGLAYEIHENLNRRHFLPDLVAEVGGETVQSYLNQCHRRYMKTNTFIMKTNFWDMAGFIPMSYVKKLFPRVRYIYVYRRDLVAQAYSLWKASKTGILHLKRGQERPPSIGIVNDYEIIRTCMSIQKECLQWQYYFLRNSIKPKFVCYEDFLSSHDDVVKSCYRFVSGNEYQGDVASGEFVKLTDEVDKYNIDGIKERIGSW